MLLLCMYKYKQKSQTRINFVNYSVSSPYNIIYYLCCTVVYYNNIMYIVHIPITVIITSELTAGVIFKDCERIVHRRVVVPLIENIVSE